MAFIVKKAKTVDLERTLKLFEYPTLVEETDFLNTLALVPPSKGGRFDIFGNHHRHHKVVLLQRNGDTSDAFILYHGRDEVPSNAALQSLHAVLLPLLQDGEIMLTEGLLATFVLPEPKGRKQVLHDLVYEMEKNPESHPQWYKVVQAMLHSACLSNDKEGVRTCLTKGGDLFKANRKGDTPFHTAATSISPEGMDWLLSLAEKKVTPPVLKNTLQRQNSRGFNTLGMAVRSENKAVLKPLVKKMSSLGVAVGIQGESPSLHVAATQDNSDEIWAVIDKQSVIKSPINKRPTLLQLPNQLLAPTDCNGITPLMVSVQNGFVNSSASLLHGGVDPNYCNPTTGNTALHYAAETANLTLVRMLCTFGADATIKNEAGKTPVDTAHQSQSSGAEKCAVALEEMIQLQLKARSLFEATKAEPFPDMKPGTLFLLSMDGGGVRALNTSQIILAIEKRMKQLQPNCDSFASYFDFVAGTSAGGVAALLLGHLEAPVSLTRALLMRYLTFVVSKPKAKREKLTWDFYKDILGSESTLDEVSVPKTMIMCTLANQSPPILHMMCNYGDSRNGQKAPSERKLWEAACATGAAPSYFPAFESKFLDGGLMANNPTLEAIMEIFAEGKKLERMPELGCVLSIGTGFAPSKPVDNIDFFIPSARSAVTKFRENVSSLSNLFSLLLTQVTQSDGSEERKPRMWCESLGVPYFRFSPELHDDINLATTDMHVIYEMLFNTEKYILESSQKIDRIAKLLLTRKFCNKGT